MIDRIGNRERELHRQWTNAIQWKDGLRERGWNRWFLGFIFASGLLILGVIANSILDFLQPRWWDGFLSIPPVTLARRIIGYLGVLGYVVLMLIAVARSRPRDVNLKLATIIASEGYCPCCVYPLTGQRVQPDGCTVCPECGCAIKIETTGHHEAVYSERGWPRIRKSVKWGGLVVCAILLWRGAFFYYQNRDDALAPFSTALQTLLFHLLIFAFAIVPVLCAAFPTAVAWWLDARARRREARRCVRCGYPRRGLATDGMCPECGTSQRPNELARPLNPTSTGPVAAAEPREHGTEADSKQGGVMNA